MQRSEGLVTHHREEISLLRCWKCRKSIASSGSFMQCLGSQAPTDSHDSADENICPVWHMNVEALPEWINCLIQNAHWTAGRLNCPFCGARLGGFNFVNPPKCACGQPAAVQLSKRRTDPHPARAAPLPSPSPKYWAPPGVQSAGDKAALLAGAAPRSRKHGLSSMALGPSGPGRLTDALALEVRPPYLEMKSANLLFKASDSKYQLFVPQLVTGKCARAFHRKCHSLDLNLSERLTLLPALYEIRSPPAAYPRLSEAQRPGLPGPPRQAKSKTGYSCQIASSFDPNVLLQRFSVAPCETQAQRGELQCGLEAPPVYSDRPGSGSLTFLVDLPSASRSVLEASDQEDPLSPLDFLHASTFSLGAIKQRLSKRERSKLKNLRRKQRRHERWLQKQTLNDEVSTDDDNEYAEEKESYMCAVCLDVYFNPYMCYPCHHIFCEPCLRTLAKDNPASTPCPLCRTIISRVFFQTELNNATKTSFTKEYLKIKQSFQKSSSAKWPLPSCRKAFHLFGGFHRRAAPVTRRQFPHGAHRMDYLHFEDDSRAWWFDMDMVIIYIYSVNWVIGFVVFCFLCYFFFPF